MSKVDYRPQQNNVPYWRIVANQGRGAHMTLCLHEACDFIHKLESENAELVEALRDAMVYMDSKRPGRDDAYMKARALLAKLEAK